MRGTPPHKAVASFLSKGQKIWFEGGISISCVVEVARAHLNAFERGFFNERYILAGENLTFQELFTDLARIAQKPAPRFKLGKSAIFIASKGATFLYNLFGREFQPAPTYVQAIVGRYSWYSSEKAVRDLDYKIIPKDILLSQAVSNERSRKLGIIELGIQHSKKKISHFSKEPLLITGVPGWLGNRMVDILINGDRSGRFASHRMVRLYVEPKFRGILKLPANFEIVYGDICDQKSIEKALVGIRSVFHLAGSIYPPKTSILYKVNFIGTRTLVDACIASSVRRFIYMGTDSVCGRGTLNYRIFNENSKPKPYRHYGRSKFLGEDYLLRKTNEGKIDGTSLRGFWFFGPFAPSRQKKFARMFNWRRQLVFGNGTNLRSILHIDDLVAAFIQAESRSETFGKWYWVCAPRPYQVEEIYRGISAALQAPYRPVYLPVTLCNVFNTIDLLMQSCGLLHPTIHAAGKFYFDIAGDIAAARRDFDFEPRMLLDDVVKELADEIK